MAMIHYQLPIMVRQLSTSITNGYDQFTKVNHPQTVCELIQINVDYSSDLVKHQSFTIELL